MENTPILDTEPVIRFSEALKRQIVREIDSGKQTWVSARRHYGIKGHETIQRWHRKYSPLARRGIVVRMMSTEQSRSKEDQQRIRDLEHALADAQLRIGVLETLIDLAEETYHIPVRKNSGAKQSSDTKPGGKA